MVVASIICALVRPTMLERSMERSLSMYQVQQDNPTLVEAIKRAFAPEPQPRKAGTRDPIVPLIFIAQQTEVETSKAECIYGHATQSLSWTLITNLAYSTNGMNAQSSSSWWTKDPSEDETTADCLVKASYEWQAFEKIVERHHHYGSPFSIMKHLPPICR